MTARTASAPTRIRAPGRTPLRTATAVSLGAAVLALAVELVVPGGWGAAAETVLIAGLLLGLPHGAVDHLLPDARMGRSLRRRVVVGGGYAALAVLTYLAFWAAPGAGLAVFVALSVWHFGTGETAVADLRSGGPVRRREAMSAAAAFLAPAAALGHGGGTWPNRPIRHSPPCWTRPPACGWVCCPGGNWATARSS